MPLQAPSIRIHGTTATFVAEPDADVFYSTDGREPTALSSIAPRNSPVELGQRHLIVKAMATRGGERSPVQTTMYVYTPRPLVIQPDDGVYDGEVMVHFQSEHDEIRYTTDGSVPSKHSPTYEGPFVLSNEGKVVVTAGMFVGDRLVGGIGRRTYEIAQAKLEPPVVSPEGGRLVVPIRIGMASEGNEIRYTLDGSDPTPSAPRYNGPILLLQEGEVTLKCRSYPKNAGANNRRPSEVLTMQYVLTFTGDDDEGGQPGGSSQQRTHPVTVLPVSNVEFSQVEEHMASETAEKTVAMLQATRQVKQDVIHEHDALKQRLTDTKREHKSLLSRLDAIQKELGIAAARKSLLQSHLSSQLDVTARTKGHLEALHQTHLELKQHLFSTNVEVSEAERLLRQTTTERQAVRRQRETLQKGLQEAYIENKRVLAGADPHLMDEVAECTAVLAEQRHELWLLKETLASLHRTLATPSASAAEFLPQGKPIDVSVVEVSLPIPRGKMRLITGAAGNGLHKLRDANKVQAHIVQQDDALCLRVCGHSKGVHNLITQVGRLLNE